MKEKGENAHAQLNCKDNDTHRGAESTSFFIGSRVHENDEHRNFMLKEENHTGFFNDKHSRSLPSNSFDVPTLTYAQKLPYQSEEETPSRDFKTCSSERTPDFKDCMDQDDDYTAYLINLRNEFKDMPVMMFYNLVRLWHVQQTMSNIDDQN